MSERGDKCGMRWWLKALIIVGVVTVLGGLLAPIISGRLRAREGSRRAVGDIQAGILRYTYFGIPREWNVSAAEELQESYGIEVTYMDAAEGWVFEHKRRYNEEVSKYLADRYGRDVISEVFAKHWEQQYHEPQAQGVRDD